MNYPKLSVAEYRVCDDPRSAAAWEELAKELTAAGDSRGELISNSLALESGNDSPAATRKFERILIGAQVQDLRIGLELPLLFLNNRSR
jgi:hypothetical protein